MWVKKIIMSISHGHIIQNSKTKIPKLKSDQHLQKPEQIIILKTQKIEIELKLNQKSNMYSDIQNIIYLTKNNNKLNIYTYK